jgi:hypothetical protein
MGTGAATLRIHSGQIITVDGTAGRVILSTDEKTDETNHHFLKIFNGGGLCPNLYQSDQGLPLLKS